MNDQWRNLKIALLALAIFHRVYFCLARSTETLGITGLLYKDGAPVGGDSSIRGRRRGWFSLTGYPKSITWTSSWLTHGP